MHATCRLTYKVNGRFTRFAATIGIDEAIVRATRGKGDCVFVVTGDGKELFRQRMKGGESPKTIDVDIADVKEVTLALEMGDDPDLDLADHGNWCDARFIRD